MLPGLGRPDELLHQGAHVQGLGLEGEGVGGEGLLLEGVDVVGGALGHGEDQSDADDANAPREGGEGGAPLFGAQVLQGEAEGGEQGHGGLFHPLARHGLGPVRLPLPLGLLGGEGRGVPGDPAVQNADDPGGVLLRQLGVVGDHDDEPVLGDLLQDFHDLDAGLAVQGAGGLVRQDDVRVVDQGPGDGHPLHLAAGHLAGLLFQLVPQPHPLQGLFGPAAALCLGHPGEGEGQLHVLQHGLVGDEVVALEHEPDGVVPVGVPVPVLKVLGGAAVDDQVPRGVLVQAAHDVQQGGFAAARGAQDGHEFPAAELEADAPQGLYLPLVPRGVVLVDVFQFQHNVMTFLCDLGGPHGVFGACRAILWFAFCRLVFQGARVPAVPPGRPRCLPPAAAESGRTGPAPPGKTLGTAAAKTAGSAGRWPGRQGRPEG